MKKEKAKKKVKPKNCVCIECGHEFNKKIGPRTFEIRCPKCHGYDVEPNGLFF